MSGETTEAQTGQDGKFGERENTIGLAQKNDDLVAVHFFEAQAPTSGSFTTEQGGMVIGLRLGLVGRNNRRPDLPQDAVLNHRTPIIGIKHHKRVADRAIGQIHGPVSCWHPDIPPTHDRCVDGLPLIVAPMGILGLLRFAIAIVGRQSLDAHQFGAGPLFGRGLPVSMPHHSLAHLRSFAFGKGLGILRHHARFISSCRMCWYQLDLPQSAHAKFVICDCTIENRLHWRHDVTLGEDHSQVRTGCAPQILAVLNNTLLALMDFLGVSNVPAQMCIYQAHPIEGLRLLLVKL
jgi:hypothetical protein